MIRLLFALSLALLAGRANSGLIEVDLFAPGDGLVTLDTDTGLEWLDLDQTDGLSFNDITINGAGGWAALGFAVAQQDQIAQLFANAGFIDTMDPSARPTHMVTNALAAEFFALFAVTATDFPDTELLSSALYEFDDDTIAFAAVSTRDTGAESSGASILPPDDRAIVRSKDFNPNFGGAWLVRQSSVPEPSTIALLLLGGAGLGMTRRRRTRATDR